MFNEKDIPMLVRYEMSNYLIHDGAHGCAVNRPGLWTIKDEEARE